MNRKFLLTNKILNGATGVIKSLALVAFISFGLLITPANALVIGLFDYGFNIDGGISDSLDPLPAGVDGSGFDFFSGLGVIEITVSGAGAHNVVGFFDHEIDQFDNTFFNEEGAAGGGALSAGQSWEIDEPGFMFGDIFDNVVLNSLDNSTAFGPPDDVSMAMGFDFLLTAVETATISFFVGLANEAPGFFLEQFDQDSDASIFFWGSLAIAGGNPDPDPDPSPLPEPGTLLLLATGLLGLGLRRRRLGSR